MRKLLEALERFLQESAKNSRDKAVAALVKRAEAALAKVFQEQGKDFIDGLGSSVEGWESALDAAAEATQPTFISILSDVVGAGLEAGAAGGAGDLGIEMSFTLKNPRAVAYLKEHGAELVAGIDDTTREYIKAIVTAGVENGDSYDTIAKAITDRYKEFAEGRPQEHIDSRAHLIAVTEASEAYEKGNEITVDDLVKGGLAMEKYWLTSGDDKVSDGCQENQDAGWIPVDQTFPSGHMHPLRFPGCRCNCLYRRVGAGGD